MANDANVGDEYDVFDELFLLVTFRGCYGGYFMQFLAKRELNSILSLFSPDTELGVSLRFHHC